MDQNKLMEIFGTNELIKLFEDLDQQNQNKILQTSFKKAALLIIDEGRKNLKGNYTHVSKSLGISYKKNIQTLSVGAQKLAGGNLAHIVESGTKERSYKTKEGNIHKTGFIKANHFWSNAIAGTEDEVKENSGISFAVGQVITIEQMNAGVITVTPIDAAVTLNGNTKTRGQYFIIQAVQVATNNWTLIGGIT